MMSTSKCHICEEKPVLGADRSAVLVHSLSGLRALKHTRNKELHRATQEFEVKIIGIKPP